MNTSVYLYGQWAGDKNKLIAEFDWGKILSRSKLFTHKHGVFSVPNVCDITVKAGDVEVSPAGEKALRAMEKAVEDCYRCRCHIYGDFTGLNVCMLKQSSAACSGIRTGDRVKLGRWKQGENREVLPIYWRVLNLEDGIATLITEDCLIFTGYCDAEKANVNRWYLMWGNSLAREVCCGQFYNSAFNEDEKPLIVPKFMSQVRYGPRCRDEVFLLSQGEAALFLGDAENLRAKLSPRLFREVQSGRYHLPMTEEYGVWWLLPEETDRYILPKAVSNYGEIFHHSRNAYHGDFALRPCIQVDAEALSELLSRRDYTLSCIRQFENAPRENVPGNRTARHDVITGEWRLTVQLDSRRLWFLTVFVDKNGVFEGYSLDFEAASDSHYRFRDEAGLRKAIYCPGDEKDYLAEVLIRYVENHGGDGLLNALMPFVTEQYHFD